MLLYSGTDAKVNVRSPGKLKTKGLKGYEKKNRKAEQPTKNMATELLYMGKYVSSLK